MGVYDFPQYGTAYNNRPSYNRHGNVWDPWSTLKFDNPVSGCLDCVGFAPSQGRRCRNPINKRNRGIAQEILDTIGREEPDPERLYEDLYELAECTLCVRNHQGQVHDMVAKWQRTIDRMHPEISQSDLNPKERESLPKTSSKARLEELFSDVFDSDGEIDLEAMTKFKKMLNKMQNNKQGHGGLFGHAYGYESVPSNFEDLMWKARKSQQEIEKEKDRREEEERRAEERRQEDVRRKREQERKAREKAEKKQKQRERAEQEQREWDSVWQSYVKAWTVLSKDPPQAPPADKDKYNDASQDQSTSIPIPWPTRSGLRADCEASTVEEFFRRGPALGTLKPQARFKLFQRECLKWHPDKLVGLFRRCGGEGQRKSNFYTEEEDKANGKGKCEAKKESVAEKEVKEEDQAKETRRPSPTPSRTRGIGGTTVPNVADYEIVNMIARVILKLRDEARREAEVQAEEGPPPKSEG